MNRIGILLLTVWVLGGIDSVYAQPQPGSPWPMIHHDQFHTGRSIYNGPETPTLKWTFITGSSIRSSPAIGADGTIYIVSQDGYLYAINPNGTEKWRFSLGAAVESSPAIGADGTIYVGADFPFFFAVNPNGTEKWTYDMGAVTWPSPTISPEGRVYVGAYGHGTFYAL
ncbi:PQQ-like beta-propeller repeat protein, partial [candidate division TA06 bacterium]|nr:PQQ-like beta-propeller repeat protein [candidate division TA06 bacterium]